MKGYQFHCLPVANIQEVCLSMKRSSSSVLTQGTCQFKVHIHHARLRANFRKLDVCANYSGLDQRFVFFD